VGAARFRDGRRYDQDSVHRRSGRVSGCPRPSLRAGAPAGGPPPDLLRTVAGALEAGAAGTAIGRRVWQSLQPRRLLELFGQLMHGQISLEQALAAVEGWS
jgi:class I fructose-bisphosphate aldolase